MSAANSARHAQAPAAARSGRVTECVGGAQVAGTVDRTLLVRPSVCPAAWSLRVCAASSLSRNRPATAPSTDARSSPPPGRLAAGRGGGCGYCKFVLLRSLPSREAAGAGVVLHTRVSPRGAGRAGSVLAGLNDVRLREYCWARRLRAGRRAGCGTGTCVDSGIRGCAGPTNTCGWPRGEG